MQALAGRVAGGSDPVRPGVVHRLDRDTSGLLVLARTEQAYFALSELIRRRDVTREYLAPRRRAPAGAHRDDRRAARPRPPRAHPHVDGHRRPARRRHPLRARWRRSPGATLLRVRLETGRTHQIRAHLLAIGHPVLGDPEYGEAGRSGLERQFLHAERLAFTHPVTGEAVDLRSPLPDDLGGRAD